MEYLPPFTVMGTHNISDKDLEEYTLKYEQLICELRQSLPFDKIRNCEFLNDTPQLKKVTSK
ncbi:MAG TPA: hypothetical protein DIT95_20690 [Arenibacter sp.]|nr:hypothetical protein [Arenibacter sp.]